MKIIFICSSFEPGRDGVGDYTRRLASELIRQGHRAVMLALNDKFISESIVGFQISENINVPVLRYPAEWADHKRFSFAKKYIDEFKPDWLSLQFVIFAYHPKGLPLALANKLAHIGAGKRWHIMFHELWVGMAIEESRKLIWWGKAQRFLIKYLLNKLRPAVIHTQTTLYQSQLSKLGINAGYLPLFGNIPVEKKTDNNFTKNGATQLSKITFVVFGLLHSGAPIDKFANEAAQYSRKSKIPIIINFAGRNGIELERWSNICKAEGLTVNLLGEISEQQISALLSNSTMGISSTALAVIEKSSTLASMRDHALPVISVSKKWQPKGIPKQPVPDGIIEYVPGNFEECIAYRNQAPFNNSIEKITNEFIISLSKFN